MHLRVGRKPGLSPGRQGRLQQMGPPGGLPQGLLQQSIGAQGLLPGQPFPGHGPLPPKRRQPRRQSLGLRLRQPTVQPNGPEHSIHVFPPPSGLRRVSFVPRRACSLGHRRGRICSISTPTGSPATAASTAPRV